VRDNNYFFVDTVYVVSVQVQRNLFLINHGRGDSTRRILKLNTNPLDPIPYNPPRAGTFFWY